MKSALKKARRPSKEFIQDDSEHPNPMPKCSLKFNCPPEDTSTGSRVEEIKRNDFAHRVKARKSVNHEMFLNMLSENYVKETAKLKVIQEKEEKQIERVFEGKLTLAHKQIIATKVAKFLKGLVKKSVPSVLEIPESTVTVKIEKPVTKFKDLGGYNTLKGNQMKQACKIDRQLDYNKAISSKSLLNISNNDPEYTHLQKLTEERALENHLNSLRKSNLQKKTKSEVSGKSQRSSKLNSLNPRSINYLYNSATSSSMTSTPKFEKLKEEVLSSLAAKGLLKKDDIDVDSASKERLKQLDSIMYDTKLQTTATNELENRVTKILSRIN